MTSSLRSSMALLANSSATQFCSRGMCVSSHPVQLVQQRLCHISEVRHNRMVSLPVLHGSDSVPALSPSAHADCGCPDPVRQGDRV